ncbi:MAG: GNAT family N-acetyltransferase [Dermatophilus congolensis]|nr:GNAT family N-acetyltransferase [Dermatophilus congolensis]
MSELAITPLDSADPSALRARADLMAHVFQFPRLDDAQVAAMAEQHDDGDRTSVVFDDGQAVASFRSFDTTLSVPGGASVAANGVTGVVVLPTHKRRGLLRRWVAADADASRERGAVASVLYASEVGIYGRFAYGPATAHASATLDIARGRFRDEATGSMRIVTGQEALDVLPEIGRMARAAVAGSIEPTSFQWRSATGLLPVPRRHDGLWFAVHRDATGRPDGVVGYTLKDDWRGGTGNSIVTIQLLQAATPVAERELWRHCASVDFASTVEYSQATPDNELRWWVTDQRAVTSGTIWDGLWVRIHDVPGALSARRYPMSGQVTVHVLDSSRQAEGRYRLTVDETGAGECIATSHEADLTLDVADLGSLWLGGGGGVPSLGALVRSGRATLAAPCELPRLSALFGWPVPARSLTRF